MHRNTFLMRLRHGAVAALALLAALHAVAADDPCTAAPAPAPRASEAAGARDMTAADVEAWLDGFLPYAMKRADVAGAVVVVVKNGQTLVKRGYGYADVQARRPVDPESTVFRGGSVSKLFTAAAVMQQVERGRIDLDADVNRYLDFKIEGAPVTMRQLLTHTAGFQDTLKDQILLDVQAPQLGELLRRRVPPRIFPAGTVPAYSNFGVALAGYIVERVSGLPFAQYVQRHIFAPLQMHNSTFEQPVPGHLRPLMSRGYLAASDDPFGMEIFSMFPAGGVSSSGGDMAKFMTAYLQGGRLGEARILNADTIERQMQPAVCVTHPLVGRMALGFWRSSRNGHAILSHDGDTRLFHSTLNLLPDDGIGVFASFNSTGRDQPATAAIRQALMEGFVDRYLPGPALAGRVDADVAKAHAQLMAGEYLNSRREDIGFFSLVGLLTQATVTPQADGAIQVSLLGLNGREKRYREVQPFLWQEEGGQDLIAARVVDGKVAVWSDGTDASSVFTPAGVFRRASVVSLLLVASMAVVFVGSVAGLLRGSASPRRRRWLPLAGLATTAVMVGWIVLLWLMISTFLFTFEPDHVSSRMEVWVSLLQVLSGVLLPVLLILSLLAVRGAFRQRPVKALWFAVFSAASAFLLWFAWSFDLISRNSSF